MIGERSPQVEQPGAGAAGLGLASRGDALTPYLSEALERRYGPVARLDPELRPWQRYAVAARTVRPSRARWADQFYKSGLGYDLRTANARQQYAQGPPAAVLQVHALFEVPGARTLLYVDCTHRQSAEQWPAWNPLRGQALHRWYDRERAAYLRARHVFAFSRETRQSLVEQYGVPPERVSVVGAGINTRVLPEPRSTAPAGPPTILFVGNDFERKGGAGLLRAFGVVRETLPDTRLVLVGTPPPVAAPPGVEVLGRMHDHERVLGLYREATVFCLPSLFDPLPLVLLEAMAFGLPCVATPTCGVPDLVRDGVEAALVPQGDAGRLADTLLDLLLDPGRAAALGAAARARVAGGFTWDHVVTRMAPVLDEALTA